MASLVVTLPAVRAYSQYPSPAYAAVTDVQQLVTRTPGSVVGAHQRFARVLETRDLGATILPSPVMRESTALAEYWRGGGTMPVWYLSDPARGDLELVDPLSRRAVAHYGWMFSRDAFIAGVVDTWTWVVVAAGMVCRNRMAPHSLNAHISDTRALEGIANIRNRRPRCSARRRSTQRGWAARRGPVRSASCDRRMGIAARRALSSSASCRAGPAGVVHSRGWSLRTEERRPAERVRLTQLMSRAAAGVFHFEHAGWNEVEYSDRCNRRGRWTTIGRRHLFNSPGRDVTLSLRLSPLRYSIRHRTSDPRVNLCWRQPCRRRLRVDVKCRPQRWLRLMGC